jgi:hypothetical protein
VIPRDVAVFGPGRISVSDRTLPEGAGVVAARGDLDGTLKSWATRSAVDCRPVATK